MSKEAMKLALEALEWNMDYLPSQGHGTSMARDAITTIKEARAEPVQEPAIYSKCAMPEACPDHAHELYSTPPAAQRQWVGLTDEEIENCVECCRSAEGLARAIESKLKEKTHEKENHLQSTCNSRAAWINCSCSIPSTWCSCNLFSVYVCVSCVLHLTTQQQTHEASKTNQTKNRRCAVASDRNGCIQL